MKLTDKQEAWLQALESGAYKQTKQRLRTTSGFCCLGVACDVVDPTKWDDHHAYENSSAFLPSPVQDQLRLTSNGFIEGTYNLKFYRAMQKAGYTGSVRTNLTGYNDNFATFSQIAKAIREYPEAIFILNDK